MKKFNSQQVRELKKLKHDLKYGREAIEKAFRSGKSTIPQAIAEIVLQANQLLRVKQIVGFSGFIAWLKSELDWTDSVLKETAAIIRGSLSQYTIDDANGHRMHKAASTEAIRGSHSFAAQINSFKALAQSLSKPEAQPCDNALRDVKRIVSDLTSNSINIIKSNKSTPNAFENDVIKPLEKLLETLRNLNNVRKSECVILADNGVPDFPTSKESL